MIGWIILVSVVAILSYLADVGVLMILGEPVPFFGGSTISVILMISCIMMLLRAARMSRKGEKEMLREQVEELEEELKSLRQTSSRDTAPTTEIQKEEA